MVEQVKRETLCKILPMKISQVENLKIKRTWYRFD